MGLEQGRRRSEDHGTQALATARQQLPCSRDSTRFSRKGGSSRPGETSQLLVLTGVDKDDPGPASARCCRFSSEQQERHQLTCY